MPRLRHLALSGFAVASTQVAAQCPIVADLNTNVSSVQSSNPSGGGTVGYTEGPGGMTVSSFTKVGSFWYFAAQTVGAGTELWRTDGTSAGTTMVKDLNPGIASSNPAGMLACNGLLFFTCDDGVHGRELWRSDGTDAGTYLVKDILVGSNSSAPGRLECMGPYVYFGAMWNVSAFWGLWRTDGTAAGTVEILTTTGTHVAAPQYVRRNSNGTELYFSAMTGSNTVLWKCNGSVASEVTPAAGLTVTNPRYFHNLNGVTIFSAQCIQAGARGIELARTDGTAAGTVMIRDINPGFASSSPKMERESYIGNEYFFAAIEPTNGTQLWKTNGTTASLAATIPGGGFMEELCANGSTLYFSAQNINGRELWKYSGGSISMVADLIAGGVGSFPRNFAPWGSGVAFTCSNATFGAELWVSNGTPGGTTFVQDIYTGTNSSSPEWMTALGGGRVVFAAYEPAHGKELWTSNGTAAGTALLKDVDPVATTQSSSPSYVTSIDGQQLLFAASDGVVGSEPWLADGTSLTPLGDLVPGVVGSNPRSFTRAWFGDHHATLFVAGTAGVGDELWISDGAPGGPVLLADINPGPVGSSIQQLVPIGARVFFTADDGSHGRELWVSDGTPAGTTMVADLLPGSGSGIAAGGYLTGCFGFAVFAADDGVHGIEPWISNGSTAGTAMIADIEPGAVGSNPRQLTSIGNRVVFAATTTTQGEEPWATDGTPGGTTILNDIAFLNAGSTPDSFTRSGGAVFFTATNAAVGNELWKTNGTPAGTAFVADINPGAAGSGATGLTDCNGTLFFVASDAVHGAEPWTSNGSGAGTSMLADLQPGTSSSTPSGFTCSGARVYFAATTTATGNELWYSNGAGTGVQLLCDVRPGADSSAPHALRVCNGRLYFAATDAVLGTELFVVDPSLANAEQLGIGCTAWQPTLQSSTPVLGGTVVLKGSGSPPGSLGVIAFGGPSAGAFVTPYNPFCPLWIDLLLPVTLLPDVIITPTWTAAFGLPNSPSLNGTQAVLQGVFFDIATVFPMLTSNGVKLTAGT